MKILCSIIIVVIFALFGIGFFYLETLKEENGGWLINQNQVLGSAVISQAHPYILNYDQQQFLFELLNESIKKQIPYLDFSLPEDVENIVIYHFLDVPDVILTPVQDDFSYFQVSSWETPYFLEIKQPLELKNLLKKTHD